MLGTTISNNIASVMTVEHILAAFAGLGIDNALIDLDGPEVPFLDGSSASLIFGFLPLVFFSGSLASIN